MIIEIKGKNNVINQSDNYVDEGLCFYPHSEVKFFERNVKLINNTDNTIIIGYNEAWYAFEAGPIPDFHGLKSELLGEEMFSR